MRPADDKDGPVPRSTTDLLLLPVMIKPAIIALSPVSTRRRVAMFNASTVATVRGVALGVGLGEPTGVGEAVADGVAEALGLGVGVGVGVATGVGLGVGVGIGGATSSLTIVPVASALLMLAPVGLLKWTVNVSVGSNALSPLTSTVICWVV